MPTKLQTSASLHYCERIKSDSAREYAKQYLAFITGNSPNIPPEVPGEVDDMAAQRIRIHIKVLLD